MSLEHVTPSVAAARKVIEVGADGSDIEGDVYAGYWAGCQAYAEPGEDAWLGTVIDYALSAASPGDPNANFEHMNTHAGWSPDDLGGVAARYAYIGAVESWWGDRGDIVLEPADARFRRAALLTTAATDLALYTERQGV